jgi:hypothetical protein
MFVFVDTEFNSFEYQDLVSVGLVSLTGVEHYVEIKPDVTGDEGWDPKLCSQFVRDVVWPMLGPADRAMTRTQAARSIVSWLSSLGSQDVVILCDHPVDWQLLSELTKPFLHHPRTGRLETCTAANESLDAPQLSARLYTPSRAAELVRSDGFSNGLRRHHALDDAKALRQAWLSGL